MELKKRARKFKKSIFRSAAWVLGFLLFPAGSYRAAGLAQSPLHSALELQEQDVSRTYAYPVPFRAARGDSRITFAFLPSEGSIRIYTLAGEMLRQIDFSNPVDGKMEWDVTNGAGEKLGTDVFVYIVQSGGSRKTGKIVVMR